MLPGSIDNLLRMAGIVISAILAVQPWFITTCSEDPFLFSSWAILAAGTLSVCIAAVILLFFRPRQGQIVFASSFLMLFSAITAATLASNFITSLRSSIMIVTLLLLATFLRLARRQQDNLAVAGMVAISGATMAVYGIMQFAGFDVLTWDSEYRMVGTFSNPNYYGIFLVVTALITLGLARELPEKEKQSRVIFSFLLGLQLLAIFLCMRTGIVICLVAGLILFFSHFWEIKPGKFLRRSPFVSGLILALIFAAFYGLAYFATSSYPWESLNKMPYRYMSIVSRMILWQMGYGIFLDHPLTGLGPGAISYLMPMQRPPQGSILGIKIFNDDPHSAPVALLAELGFWGLWAVCSIIVIIYGCFVWKRFKGHREIEPAVTVETVETLETVAATGPFPWAHTAIAAVIAFLAYQANFISAAVFLYSIPLIVAYFGLQTAFSPGSADDAVEQSTGLSKATMVALLTFMLHSLFNNSLGVPPLTGFMLLIFSLHFSSCQRNIVWKRKFSYLSLVFIIFPALYVFTAYNFQIAHQREQMNLWQGQALLGSDNPAEAQQAFTAAIQANPQSLKAHYGLALSLEKQNRLDETQDILKRLDAMVPNAFNSNYELARILFERKQILEAHRYALKNLQWDQAPRAYELLGKILLVEGKQQEAEKIFAEGLLMIPGNIRERMAADRIRLSLAALAANRGEFDACEKVLNQITTEVKNEVDALYLSGMLLSRQKKLDEALALFEKALELYPQNPKFMNAVGYILSEKKIDLERAQKLLEDAYQGIRSTEQTDLADLLMITHSLGKLYWQLNKLKEARELLQIAYDQCPAEWAILKEERRQDLAEFFEKTGMEPAQ